ncbi:MAG: DUF6079 family protein [Bacillus sp. (in: Bacteria)]|nr:DUF6079 family protein [Bacillus sp. (in: firmicutes)]
MFGIGRGYLQNNALDVAVAQLNKESREKLNEVVTVHHEMKDGIPTWEGPLYSPEKVSDLRATVNELKDFLEHLQIYDTPAKLKNFKYSVEDVKEKQEQMELVQSLSVLRKKALELTQEANYLIRAKHQVPVGNEWSTRVDAVLKEVYEALQKNTNLTGERSELWKLKEEYKTLYLTLHDKARLTATEEGKKNALLHDPRFESLKGLSTISILSEDQLNGWKTRLDSLKGCWQLTKDQLDHKEICGHCQFTPKEEGSNRHLSLEQLADELEELAENWSSTLYDNLAEPEIKNNIPLLGEESRRLMDAFLTNRQLEHPVSNQFVSAVKELLQGIEKITITFDDLEQMMKNGSPLTVDELKGSFEQLLRNKVGSTPSKNIRVLLKNGGKALE